MRVRDAAIADLAEIVEIYNHAVVTSTATFDTEPTTVEARQSWFAKFSFENPIVVAEIEGRVAGFAYYLPYRERPGYRTSKELTVYISPDYQRRGVGTALYTELIDRAIQRGVHALVAVLGGENPSSVALHRKLGFVEVGRLREVGKKFGAWIDTPIYQRLL